MQIARSAAKFRYCKVTPGDVRRYRALVVGVLGGLPVGPIVCLGTRNGREVDLFRCIFYGLPFPPWWWGRNRFDRLGLRDVVGVEINPGGARRDIWTGSFDDMPAAWAARFGLLFSNSFDHAYDPEATAAAWCRLLRPGGLLILAYTVGASAAPTATDPVGELTAEDLRRLFGGVLIAEGRSEVGYREIILRR
jgi:hypothetical protein